MFSICVIVTLSFLKSSILLPEMTAFAFAGIEFILSPPLIETKFISCSSKKPANCMMAFEISLSISTPECPPGRSDMLTS